MSRCTFEFLRNSKVYLQHGSNYYNLHVGPDVSFGQTFKQGEYKTKTLHNQKNLFEGSTITTANPASFSFRSSFKAKVIPSASVL